MKCQMSFSVSKITANIRGFLDSLEAEGCVKAGISLNRQHCWVFVLLAAVYNADSFDSTPFNILQSNLITL